MVAENILYSVNLGHDVPIDDWFATIHTLIVHKHLQRTTGTIFSIPTAIMVWMEYQVPQFIEVEDKIVGPLTLRQFIYIAGATGICVVFFVSLSFVAAFLLSAPIVALAAALAFYKINGKPFIEVLEAGFNYYTGAKLFLWKHGEPAEKEKKTVAAAKEASLPQRGTPKLTRGRLSELAWSLDIQQPASNSQLPTK